MKKVVLIVLDSVGIGALPDARAYGDQGADTLGHIATSVAGFALPQLAQLGLGRIEQVRGIEAAMVDNHSYYGRMQEASRGKDTVTGHWEMAGIVTTDPSPVFPEGFPAPLVRSFTEMTGLQMLGNEPASGTEIIARLGDQHVRSGWPIVYTSADSVMQIAAHEAVLAPEKLYEICQLCRARFAAQPYNIGRIIARPFIGEHGHYTRTSNRRDFALPPPTTNLLMDLSRQHQDVLAVGKIADIFAHTGITKAIHTVSNDDGVRQMLRAYDQLQHGLLFTNLVDFDAQYGHRRDPLGYSEALMAFDRHMPRILAKMDHETLLIITADHGCDPTAQGTDHTREYVPLLIYGKGLSAGHSLGTIQSFASLGATIADYLQASYSGQGVSILKQLF